MKFRRHEISVYILELALVYVTFLKILFIYLLSRDKNAQQGQNNKEKSQKEQQEDSYEVISTEQGKSNEL